MRRTAVLGLAVGVGAWTGPLRPSGPEATQVLTAPPGFVIGRFAEGLGRVRYLALGPDGVAYASITERDGRIVRLPDRNRDGIAETVETVARGLDRPFGLAFRGDSMYVAEPGRVVRIDPTTGMAVTVVPDLPTGGHSTRTVAFGPDGALYVAVGSSCDVCDERDTRRAAVIRYRVGDPRGELYATGLRNPVALAFHPETGRLWAATNERDHLGDDYPADRLDILVAGGHYGWPRCRLPGEPNPEYPDADCADVLPPTMMLPAHSAPIGLVFYTGAGVPAEYRGDALVTYHGSWNRSVPTGAKLVRVLVEDGRPVGVEDFVVGWQRPDGSRWGRPAGLLVLPDASVLVADDQGGRVWVIRYQASIEGSTGTRAIRRG